MKAHLLFSDRDADFACKLAADDNEIIKDLGLATLIAVMAQDDAFLADIAAKALLGSLTDVGSILYRQAVLRDCMQNPAIIRDIYQLAVDAIESERQNSSLFFERSPSSVVRRSMRVLRGFEPLLRHLRFIADAHANAFRSAAFCALFSTLRRELDDSFFAQMVDHLHRLEFRDGVLMSARLGQGAKGEDIVLRTPWPDERWWFERLLGPKSETYVYQLHPRDENGYRALTKLDDQAMNSIANPLRQATDHILHFFQMLRAELAFYVGCLNARDALNGNGASICIPTPTSGDEPTLVFRRLVDAGLALANSGGAVGNDLDGKGKILFIVTGANQGGKTTFSRSVGQAQLMMQAGMFVAADSFTADVRDRLFTHYKREEEADLKSGKLDEELGRMSAIADALTTRSMVVFNESFAATNEREGSELNIQIVRALIESGVKVVLVTHLYDFAKRLHDADLADALFLRAERREDGSRTFRILEGAPLQTSFGADLYREIFSENASDETLGGGAVEDHVGART